MHIQFIYGLFVVGLFMGINLLQRLARWVGIELDFIQAPTLPLPGLIGVLFACFAATFIGPYTYHLYHVVAAYSNSHVPYYICLLYTSNPNYEGKDKVLELMAQAKKHSSVKPGTPAKPLQ